MAWSRADHLARLAAAGPFDTVVIGGGITGCGIALDLAARGLRVALVEQRDFASGTSGRSTKLFHGGIRYLPQLEFHLVAEGLREQQVLAEIADYLFQPLEFVIPLYQQYGIADAPSWAARGRRAVAALKAGLLLYDLLGGRERPGERHRHLTASQVLELVPSLRPEGLRSGYVYSDAQTDDARLVLAVVRTAVERYGAVAVNRIQAGTLHHRSGTYQVEVTDQESGQTWPLSTRTVVAATGAFPAPGLVGAQPLEIVTSKGAHLLFDRQAVGLADHAVVLPETEDERVLFIIPWQGHALVGTTDTAYHGDLDHPRADEADIAYLLRHVERFLDVARLEPLATFAGLRALANSGEGSTAHVSRDHLIAEPHPGYVQVAGGKLTTYRRISAEAAARVARHLRASKRSPTGAIPLVGAGGDLRNARTRLTNSGFTGEAATAAVSRYGAASVELTEVARIRPDLATTLGDGRTTGAEVVHAVRFEAATTLADFTLRRTRLAWLTPDHARKDQDRIAELMAAELGWDQSQRTRQVAAHEAELAAEGL
ncbi:MAG TPA: glycerol-3-phosphate dehydrogenase/oxidase [Acidimicrobiia bacterium]|nr:glycerol-3-phosphate dehydrogenase/oxidase [Acidimicrobiia bacterium]